MLRERCAERVNVLWSLKVPALASIGWSPTRRLVRPPCKLFLSAIVHRFWRKMHLPFALILTRIWN